MHAPQTTALATAPSHTMDAAASAKLAESLVMRGDISGMSPRERVQYYLHTCAELGLNPNAQPFAFLKLNGKEVMYPTRGATDQLARIHGVNREIIDGPKLMDLGGAKLLFAACRATLTSGRVETATAAVPLPSGGEAIANAVMKVETKARRRATLAILGLALLDESEMDTIPAAAKVHVAAPSRDEIARALEPVTSTWADDLGRCTTLREVRACWATHRTPDTDGAAMAADVRSWLDARGLSVTAEAVTALLGTLHDAAVDTFSQALSLHDAGAETIETAIVTAAHALRHAAGVDDASRGVVWKVLRRAYAKLTAAESLDDAGEALRAAVDARDGDDPEPDGDGTDGRGKGSASDDGDDASAAAYEAHRAAQGERAQVTELRVVRDESSDPCVTSAAAWAAHLATLHSKWHVCGSFRKRASAFSAEGVHAAREAATLDRLRALGEAAPRTLLYAPPPAPKKRAA